MAVAKLKRPKEDRLEELAERIGTEINVRAAKMTPEKRAQADSETKKIAARVQPSYAIRAASISSLDTL
jgi:hypothetical protein